MAESPHIKTPTQYTLKGIKMGLFDDDLGKLFRTVQRRRAALGEINVINIGKVAELPTIDDDSASDSEYRWEFNDDIVCEDLKLANIVSMYRQTTDRDSALLPKIPSFYTRFNGSISVGDRYYSKNSLVGRIVFLTPEAQQNTGYKILLVASVARRNLACWPLWISNDHASTRKRRAARSNPGQTVNVRPDDVFDFTERYQTSDRDPMMDWLLTCNGQPSPFSS